MATRVVIVDDDEWIRRGRAAALSEVDGVEVLAAVDHAEALGRPELWAETDVALIDAWDHRAGFDRFPGVGVVREIRRLGGGRDLTVIVVTGHLVNDMLRLRMAQAGADLFYGHEEVADPASLAAAVLGARSGDHVRAAASPEIRPDAALDWIDEHHVEEAFRGGAQKAVPFSRRTLINIRREVGGRAGLSGPQGLPTWRRVVEFVNRARGAELRRADPQAPGPDRPA